MWREEQLRSNYGETLSPGRENQADAVLVCYVPSSMLEELDAVAFRGISRPKQFKTVQNSSKQARKRPRKAMCTQKLAVLERMWMSTSGALRSSFPWRSSRPLRPSTSLTGTSRGPIVWPVNSQKRARKGRFGVECGSEAWPHTVSGRPGISDLDSSFVLRRAGRSAGGPAGAA